MRWLVLAMLAAGPAAADDGANARALFEQGVELYKTQKYEPAAQALAQSYKLDARPDVLFALAQAERMSGRCADAIVHYRALLVATTDLAIAKAVQNNLGLCGEPETAAGGPAPAAAAPIERVVVQQAPARRLPMIAIAAGGLAIGIGGGLYLAASASRDSADSAFTLGDYNRLHDRADHEALAGLWLHTPKRATEVAITHGHASMLTVVTRW